MQKNLFLFFSPLQNLPSPQLAMMLTKEDVNVLTPPKDSKHTLSGLEMSSVALQSTIL